MSFRTICTIEMRRSAEPLACVLRGLDESNLRPGDTLAVMGLGPIGLMFVRLAKTGVWRSRDCDGSQAGAGGPRHDAGSG